MANNYCSIQISEDAYIKIRETELINDKFVVIAFGATDVYLPLSQIKSLKRVLKDYEE